MPATSFINTGCPELDEKLNEWIRWNKDPNCDNEIRELMKTNDAKVLEKLFLKRLDFGTAGLRGRMGPGYNQMNDLVIIQTSQGLAKYLQNTVLNVAEKGIVLGYDGRYNSKRFAELTAAIFLNKGIKVIMYPKVCPTPFIPYTVQKCKSAAGVMVTASHNPKEDNGYKVYWGNGSQIISPHDKGIQKCILECLEPEESAWETSKIQQNPLFSQDLDDVMNSYYKDLSRFLLYPDINHKTNLKFTYSAMHGVGYNYMVRAFKMSNFQPFITVEEQKDPDPEFPTVKFPNPEEGKSALDLSIKTANENGSTVILANDPDADRLACAVKTTEENWHIFSGNELGALLGWWMLHIYKTQNPESDLKDVYMLSSTVSSKILSSMAKKNGFQFEETLTGFKWMGNKSIDLMQNGKTVIFAYEEAIGFMCGSCVLDKDGISAGVRLAELAAYLDSQNSSLYQKLKEIYNEYGQHICENSYWICHEQEKVKNIFDRLRNYEEKPNTYPKGVLENKYLITGVRDLTTGYDNTKPDNQATLPISKSSQMITFSFNNGMVTTLRTSGTEPKIKYYSELCASPDMKDLNEVKSVLNEMISAIVNEFLQPDVNGLIARSS